MYIVSIFTKWWWEIMKIIRTIAGIILVVGVVFPVLYNIFLLPSVEKQQCTFHTLVNELKLEDNKGIYFKNDYRIKLNFNFEYEYDRSTYSKMDIKKILFYKLDKDGWKSKRTSIKERDYVLKMEKEDFLFEAYIYDESFDIRLKYKELYE